MPRETETRPSESGVMQYVAYRTKQHSFTSSFRRGRRLPRETGTGPSESGVKQYVAKRRYQQVYQLIQKRKKIAKRNRNRTKRISG